MAPDDRLRLRLQARVRRRSRAVRWMKIVLPAGALLLIGMIFVFGSDRAAIVDPKSAASIAALGSGLRLDNPRYTGVTADGDPFVVTAEWALPDGAMPDRVKLKQPEGELHLGDARTVTVQAAHGELFRNEKRLSLTGDVVLVTSDGYRVTTPKVDVDLAAKTAVAPDRLHAQGPRGAIEANRVRIVRGEGRGNVTMRFDGDVHVTYRPAQNGDGNAPSQR